MTRTYLLGRLEKISPGREREELREWYRMNALNAGHIQEARNPIWFGAESGWAWVGMGIAFKLGYDSNKGICVRFLFGKLQIFLDETPGTCLSQVFCFVLFCFFLVFKSILCFQT